MILNIWPTSIVTLNRAVNLGNENTFAVWFSSSQLLALAVAAYFAYREDRAWLWIFVAVGFLYLSIDETASLHESFGAAIYKGWISENYGYSDWVYVFAVPIVIAIAMLGKLMLRLRTVSRTSFWFGLVGLLLWILVIVLELSDDSMPGKQLVFSSGLSHPLHIAEETCEMVGATFLLFGIGSYVIERRRGLVRDAVLDSD